MNTMLNELLDFMAGLAYESGETLTHTRQGLESWRIALNTWHEDGCATLEEVEAFAKYLETLEK